MFTQACLIRDYNKDLISKIENIGYRNYGNPFQFTDYSILYTTIDGYYVPYKVQVDSSWIDCGTNEELFLAIAALRDDSDKHQFFTNGQEWIQCEKENWIDEISSLCVGGNYNYDKNGELSLEFHKATVEELIKHFSV